MIETWKFSKGILLTALATGIIWVAVVGFAYQKNRSSEILTGVIGGLTIILGMITAEWLRASREQVELTRTRQLELITYLDRYLYNFEDYMRDPLSHEQSRHAEDFIHVFSALALLARTTRWPQPNAKKIREVAVELHAKVQALHTDAFENGYIWSLDERMVVINDYNQFGPLIWARKAQADGDYMGRVDKYRKTQPNEGIPFAWIKKPSN